MEIDDLTGIIIDSAIEIHRDLGPGLLESVYETVLASVLIDKGLRVDCQKPISFSYRGMEFHDGFRCDLVIEDLVIVELKSVSQFNPVFAKQVLTYLRLMNREVGLLLNFGAPTMKEGIKRIVNDYTPSASPRLRVNQETKDR